MLDTAIDRPIVRGTDVMQLRNARVTAAVRMLLNKAVSAVGPPTALIDTPGPRRLAHFAFDVLMI